MRSVKSALGFLSGDSVRHYFRGVMAYTSCCGLSAPLTHRCQTSSGRTRSINVADRGRHEARLPDVTDVVGALPAESNATRSRRSVRALARILLRASQASHNGNHTSPPRVIESER
jgi:hypothetical protein